MAAKPQKRGGGKARPRTRHHDPAKPLPGSHPKKTTKGMKTGPQAPMSLSTRCLIECIQDRGKTQKDVIVLYARAIRIMKEETDWPLVNLEIRHRWVGKHALDTIKREAWKGAL